MVLEVAEDFEDDAEAIAILDEIFAEVSVQQETIEEDEIQAS